ncbi:MAG: hypothetical protein M1338_05715 [Patescibacteria group bacterium]|nr:hypothetical protein [Patescibacteria group bacterium]
MTTLPTWDLFLILFFVIGIAYGFILQRDKTVITMISVYVALVITQILVGPLQDFFTGDKTIFGQFFIHANVSSFTIQVVVFAAIIALVSAKSNLAGKESGSMSPMEILGFSALNTALIISSILFFMPEAMRNGFAETSKIASILIQYHTWWILLPAALLVITGFFRKNE